MTASCGEVPSRKGFGALRNDDYPLFPVQVGTWGPLVFVNLDLDAEPLDEYLEAIPGLLEWARMDEYACAYDLTVPLPCNWKTLIEAFSETYHVQGIHREMLPSCDDVNSVNRLYGRHGSLHQPYGVSSPRLRDGATDPGDLGVHHRHPGDPLWPGLREPGTVPAGSRRRQRARRAGGASAGPNRPERP